MNKCDATTTLKKHGIQHTEQRRLILGEIFSSGTPFTAFSLKEIPALQDIDEATIFRTLSLLSEKEIIRTVGDSERGQVFERNCVHNPMHSHFHCRTCGRWSCLAPFSEKETTPLHSMVPQGVRVEKVSVVFTGVCSLCREYGKETTP